MPDIKFRLAEETDLDAIVSMLSDDPLGAKREDYRLPLPAGYSNAFDAINKDPNNELVVATLDDKIIGVLQLTFIPYLTYQGGWRGLVEGVRVASEFRSKGVGRELFLWAIQRTKDRGCHLLQLTTDKSRPDALRFYESLGFKASHEGMKLHFKDQGN